MTSAVALSASEHGAASRAGSAPPAARGKKITRSASRGISSKRLDHLRLAAPAARPAAAPRPTCPASSWRRNSSTSRSSSSAHLDVALGEQRPRHGPASCAGTSSSAIMSKARAAAAARPLRADVPSTSTGPGPAPTRAGRRAPPRRRARLALARPPRAASSPSARCAASAEECVQPEPCAAPSGMALARDLDEPLAVEEDVDRLVAVPAGDDDARAGRARGRRARAPRRRASSAPAPASTRASGRFGVTTVARGSDQLDAARRCASSVEQPRAGLGDHHRVEHDRRARPAARRAPARPPRSSRPSPSIPIFTASTPMSLGHRAHLRDDHLRRDGLDRRRRATVFCAVIAVIAVMPCTPQRGERLQVGLDAGAAAGVRAGDREHDGDAARCAGHGARRIGPGRGHHRGTAT